MTDKQYSQPRSESKRRSWHFCNGTSLVSRYEPYYKRQKKCYPGLNHAKKTKNLNRPALRGKKIGHGSVRMVEE